MVVLTEVSYDMRATILRDLRYGGPIAIITYQHSFTVSGRKFKNGLPSYSRFLNIRTCNEATLIVFNKRCGIISKCAKRLQSLALEIPMLILNELELKISTKDVNPAYVPSLDVKMFLEYLLVHDIVLSHSIEEIENLLKELSWNY